MNLTIDSLIKVVVFIIVGYLLWLVLGMLSFIPSVILGLLGILIIIVVGYQCAKILELI